MSAILTIVSLRQHLLLEQCSFFVAQYTHTLMINTVDDFAGDRTNKKFNNTKLYARIGRLFYVNEVCSLLAPYPYEI